MPIVPRYKPGESGNPGGKPSFVKACEAAGINPKKLTVELVSQLYTGMTTLNKSTASWRFCVEQLLHYRMGKPPDTVVHEFTDGGAVDPRALSNEELRDLIAAGDPEGESENDADAYAPAAPSR